MSTLGNLLAIAEYSQDLGPLWPAHNEADPGPVLEPGESVLTQLYSEVEQVNSVGGGNFVEAWKAPSPFLVTLTDRRLVYGCRDFTKGSTWIGLGVGGAVIAGTAMAVSAMRAKQRRAGRIAAGHIRHEWVANTGLTPVSSRSRNGAMPKMLVVTVGFGGNQQFVRLKGGFKPFDEQFLRYYAGLVSHHRLHSGVRLEDFQKQQLETTAAQMAPGERYGVTVKFEIPAAIDVPWFASQTPSPQGPSPSGG